MQNGKYKEALNEIEKAEKPVKELNEPGDTSILRSTKGHLLYCVDKYEEALENHILALKISENLLSEEPENKTYQSTFTVSFTEIFVLGNIFHKVGRFLQAEQCYEMHLAISQRLLKTNPGEISYQATLATTKNDFGVLLINMGRFREAKQRFEEALDVRQKILEVTPEKAIYQSDVAITLNNLGGLLTKMGHIEEAKKKLEKALEVRQWLLKKYPENSLYQSYVGGTLVNLGVLLKDMGRLEEARDRYEEALEIYEKLAKGDSEDPIYRANYAGLLDNLGKLLLDMGRVEQARQWHEKALKIRQDFTKEESEKIAYQSYLGQINNSLGSMPKQMYKWEENGQELEDYIESFLRVSLKNEFLKNFKVEKNHIEVGREGIAYEFDIFYEFTIAGIPHKAAIECQYYDKRITEEIVRHFKSKIDECNNITGFILATKSYNADAKKYADRYGIKLITDEELPNIPGMLLAHTESLVPNKDVHGDPFWTIMTANEEGNSSGAFYSFRGNIVNILMPRFLWRDNRIYLFISKKSAEMALEADGEKGYGVFGVSRELLRGICLMAKLADCRIEIVPKLRFEDNGGLLVFEHSYDEILAEYDLE